MIDGGARRLRRMRRTRPATSGHASSQVSGQFRSGERNSVTAGRLDLCIGDGNASPTGTRGPARVVARPPQQRGA